MAEVQEDAGQEDGRQDAPIGEGDTPGDRRDEVIAKLSADLDALREHKDLEVATVREEHEEARGELEARIAELEDKLREVYASGTWRTGRAVLWLPRRAMGKRQPPDEWDGLNST